MKPFVHLICAALLLSAEPAASGEDRSAKSCEPAGPVDLYARTLELQDGGSVSTAIIELTIVPHRELTAAVIHGALADGTGFDSAFGIPDRIETLGKKAIRKIQYRLELENGKEHALLFHVSGDGAEGAIASSAYLRVNLDPALEPKEIDDVVQYRARGEGGEP